MIFFLPKRKLKVKISNYLHAIYKKSRKRPFEFSWTYITCSLSVICLLLIFSYNPVTTAQFFLSFIQQTQNKPVEKTFSFIPGSAPNKFDNIVLQNLTLLSFYDLPFNTDGSLNTEVTGYESFYSERANLLFQSAKEKGTKVHATLTQTYNDDIYEFLNSQKAQDKLYEQAAQAVRDTNIDGITINVEFAGDANSEYKNKFSNFVAKFTEYMHNNIPGSTVAIALPSNIQKNSIYDIKELASASDYTLIIAYDFAVPESQNTGLRSPVFGFNSVDYQKILVKATTNFQDVVPLNKLVMERAWYGNGDNYHLYSSNNTPLYNETTNTLNATLSTNTIERLISDVPLDAQSAARKNLPFILNALKNENILNANVLAYALATIQHETANTFEPIDEYKGRKSARRLGYEGGTNYFGRGFIQLTHLRNYEKMGNRIGIGNKLVKNPNLASSSDIAARILAAYFKDFGIAELATNGNFIDARTLINPDYYGEIIAQIAYVYLNAI